MSSESLDRAVEEKFKNTSNSALVSKIERANDFGYDDEEYELTRRLKLGGQAWKWATIDGRDRVTTYPPINEDGEPDVVGLTEQELITLFTTPGMEELTYHLARDEYYRRRGKVLDDGIERARLAGLKTGDIVRSMESGTATAEEHAELTRRLHDQGLTWDWGLNPVEGGGGEYTEYVRIGLPESFVDKEDS